MAASVTAWSGGLSTITRSAAATRRSRIVCIRWDPRSSAGLGGSGPVATTRRCSSSVAWATSSMATSSVRRREVRPLALGRSKSLWTPGLRRSASRRITVRPAWAKATARLPDVVVFPSLGMELVTRSVLTGSSTEANSRFVRSVRYASAAGPRG